MGIDFRAAECLKINYAEWLLNGKVPGREEERDILPDRRG